MTNKDYFRGKTIVVTGTSSGIGLGAAIQLAELGANIVATARRTQVLDELNTNIRNKGGKIHTVTCDVSNPADIKMLEESAVSTFGGYDIWINNTGIGAFGYFWEIPVEDHIRLVDVNLNGLIYGTHTALNHFIKKGRGVVINIGSIDSEIPLALHNTYAAAKAAVLSLGRSINEELKLSGIESVKVSTILPYATDTPWWNHAANYTGHKPRMVAMDDPQVVIDSIINACITPEEKITPGTKAGASDFLHQIFPDITHSLTSKILKKEYEKAEPQPHTAGSLYEPMAEGTTVDGNIRERRKKEDN